MKVLLDTTPLQNANSIRGVGVYTRYLAQELEKLEEKDFDVISSFDPAYEQVAARGNVDLIHYPYFDLYFHTLPIHWQRNHKVVVTIHDVIPLLFPDHYPVGLRGRVHHLLQRVALSKVDGVITDSEASKKDIVERLGVPTDKVHVVYLAGNPEITAIDSRQEALAITKKYNLPEKYILYVGDINYNKNLPELMKALTLLDESVHLVCVGKNFRPQTIPEWQRIDHIIRTKHLAKRIHFITDLGSDAVNDLSTIYSLATCYVQPSLYEGFGLPVLEAMQTLTPVVSARNSSLVEVGGEVVEFVEPTAESLATGVNTIINFTSKQRAQRVSAAKKWADSFSWSKTAQQTLHVYKQL